MIQFPALIRFTELRLNTMCMNFERAYGSPTEEAIHDLRVSIRRFLTHLNFLSFLSDQNEDTSGKYRLYHKKLKRYLKSLNQIRDLQTQITTLGALSSEKGCPPKLLELFKSYEKNKLSKLASEMDQWQLQKIRKKVRTLIHETPISDKELELKSYLYLNHLTQELHNAVHYCQKPDLCGCHCLRIRLKEYRYHLEMLEQGFGIKQILIGAVKEWQNELGALQDLKVLLEQIDKAYPESDSEVLAFRATLQDELDALLNTVKDEVHAIRFETQLK